MLSVVNKSRCNLFYIVKRGMEMKALMNYNLKKIQKNQFIFLHLENLQFVKKKRWNWNKSKIRSKSLSVFSLCSNVLYNLAKLLVRVSIPLQNLKSSTMHTFDWSQQSDKHFFLKANLFIVSCKSSPRQFHNKLL